MSDPNVEPVVERTADTVKEDRLDRIESLLLRTAEALNSQNTPAPTPEVEAPTPSPVTDEAEALRERIAALEGRIVRMSQTPQRVGRAHSAKLVRNGPASSYEAIVREVEPHLPGGSALAAVCREQAPRRAAGLSDLPTRGELERDLRAVLHAAFTDGLITDPEQRAAWR